MDCLCREITWISTFTVITNESSLFIPLCHRDSTHYFSSSNIDFPHTCIPAPSVPSPHTYHYANTHTLSNSSFISHRNTSQHTLHTQSSTVTPHIPLYKQPYRILNSVHTYIFLPHYSCTPHTTFHSHASHLHSTLAHTPPHPLTSTQTPHLHPHCHIPHTPHNTPPHHNT